jgi:HEAT repeat protein
MTRPTDGRYEHDTTPSRGVVEQYRQALSDDGDASLALVHYRGGQEEFDLGAEYARSADPLDRITGADILAQLGWADRSFLDESVLLLIPLLHDPDPRVAAAAASALGHRADPRAIPPLAELAGSPDAEIRRGVVQGLLSREEPQAVRAMLQLARDPDRGVRNWATFGLGSQVGLDTPEIRDALAANVHDPDHEVRGEALVGLAERKDLRVVDWLIGEWQTHEAVSLLSIEAAVLIADSRLYPHLNLLKEELLPDDDLNFTSALTDAIAACGSKVLETTA